MSVTEVSAWISTNGTKPSERSVWDVWLGKFEAVLRRLYWWYVRVVEQRAEPVSSPSDLFESENPRTASGFVPLPLLPTFGFTVTRWIVADNDHFLAGFAAFAAMLGSRQDRKSVV